MQDVVRCSWSAQGPLLAQELLANSGIHLVIEKHLRRTYLDGSACLMPKTGAPVIGMTIRHDRIDNFWFVLLHELAHVAAHLDKPDAPRKSFFDDLEAEAQGDDEKEADALAAEALIPADAWAGFVSSPMTPGSIAKFANSLTIHPAIVAGRYRHEAKNYKRFSRMVGRNNVRKLFEEVDWPR
jgi:HTH-type transcriptional regulator/antitoxin HigA